MQAYHAAKCILNPLLGHTAKRYMQKHSNPCPMLCTALAPCHAIWMLTTPKLHLQMLYRETKLASAAQLEQSPMLNPAPQHQRVQLLPDCLHAHLMLWAVPAAVLVSVLMSVSVPVLELSCL